MGLGGGGAVQHRSAAAAPLFSVIASSAASAPRHRHHRQSTATCRRWRDESAGVAYGVRRRRLPSAQVDPVVPGVTVGAGCRAGCGIAGQAVGGPVVLGGTPTARSHHPSTLPPLRWITALGGPPLGAPPQRPYYMLRSVPQAGATSRCGRRGVHRRYGQPGIYQSADRITERFNPPYLAAPGVDISQWRYSEVDRRG